MTIALSPGRAARFLIGGVFCLVLAHILGQALSLVLGAERLRNLYLHSLVSLFNLDMEQSVAGWFSGTLLLCASALLYVTGCAVRCQSGNHYARHWHLLSGIFLYLSADEICSLHEKFGRIVPWVVPYALFALAVAVFSFRFFLSLPTETRRLFALAGVLYVGGAIGGELLPRIIYWIPFSLYNLLFVPLEEASEMLGVIAFLSGTAKYLQDSLSEFRVALPAAKGAPSVEQQQRPIPVPNADAVGAAAVSYVPSQTPV